MILEPRPPTPPKDEDDLDDLPAMDGGDDEVEVPAEELDEEDVKEDENPFDDAAAGGSAADDLEIAGEESGWLVDAADADGLDVGTADTIGEETEDLLSDNEEPGVGDEDYDLSDGAASVMDGGEEGPDADDDDLREEDLPRLDADEDGAPEDEDFFEAGFSSALADTLDWAAPAWERAGAPVHLGPMRSLAIATRGVLAAGSGITLVDLEGGREVLACEGLAGGDVTRVLADGVVIVAATERGGAFVSRDGGATFVEVNGWRELAQVEDAALGIDLSLGSSGLWGRTAQGLLLWSGDFGAHWHKAGVDGFVAAIATDELGQLVALVGALGAVEIVRGVRKELSRTTLPAGTIHVHAGARTLISACGPSVTIAVEGVSVQRAVDGVTWLPLDKTESATAIGFLDGDGAVVAAIHSESQERTWLARVGSDGSAKLVAELDGAHGECVSALAWDAAKGVVWVSGGFGVAAFQPRVAS